MRRRTSHSLPVTELEGQPLRVVIPYERARKVGVLTPRSDAQIEALKKQVGR